MKRKIILSLVGVLSFVGVVWADREIASWGDLATWYNTTASPTDVFNINSNITFAGSLINNPAWQTLTIRGRSGSSSVVRTFYGNANDGFYFNNKSVNFENIYFSGFKGTDVTSSRGAIFSIDSKIQFSGSASFINNSNSSNRDDGGAIDATKSTFSFTNANVSFNNNASFGAAIYTSLSSFSFAGGNITFNNNSQSGGFVGQGGVIYSSHSNFSFTGANVTFSNNSNVSAIYLISSDFSFEDTNLTFNNNGGYAAIMFYKSNLSIKAINKDINILFANNAYADISATLYYQENNQLLFEVSAGRQIKITNGINVEKVVPVIKAGEGDLVFNKNAAVKFSHANFQLSAGKIKMLTSSSTFYSLTVSNGATYSMINDETGKTFITQNGVISGGLAIDLNFVNETGDLLSVGGSLTVNPGSILTINLLDISGIVGNSVTIAQAAGGIIYSEDSFSGFDTTLFSVAKIGNNSLVVTLLKMPPTPWDSFVEVYKSATGEIYLSKNINALDDSNKFGEPDNDNIIIEGRGFSINSANNPDLYFYFNDKSVTINNMTINNFNNTDTQNGGAVLITGYSSIVFNDVSFKGNQAGLNGGAIFLGSGGNLTVKADTIDIVFSGNKSQGQANDIYMETGASLTLAGNKTISFEGGILGDGDIVVEQGLTKVSGNVFANSLAVNNGATYQAGVNNLTQVNAISIDGIFAVGIDFSSVKNEIVVSNSVSINPTSKLLINGFGSGTKEFTIINSPTGQVSGQFSSVILAGDYKAKVETKYDEHWVKLDITAYPLLAQINGLNGNQAAVASAFDQMSVGGDLDGLIIPINAVLESGDEAQARKNLDQLSGSFFANVLNFGAVNNNSADVYGRIDNNTIEETGEDAKEVWVMGGVKALAYDTSENLLEKFNSSGFGALLGADVFNNGDDFVGGIFGGIDQINFEQGTDEGQMSDISAGVYGAFIGDASKISGAINFGMQDFSVTRDISFIDLKPKSNFMAYSLRFGAEIKWIISVGDELGLSPFINMQGAMTMMPAVKETGGQEANLEIESGNYLRLATAAGLGLEDREGNFYWNIKGYVSYLALGAGTQEYKIKFAQSTDAGVMNIKSMEHSQILFGGGAGAEYLFSDRVSVFTNAGIELATGIFGYRFNGGFNLKF
jgi:hypothetical protein